MNYDEWVSNCRQPLKVICAAQGPLYKDWKELIKTFECETEYAVIKNATHSFDEAGTEELLYKETLKWIK